MANVTYIKKSIPKQYVEFETALSPEEYNNIGTTWHDYLDNKWVRLSNEQLTFHNEHPEASVKEVWDMEIVAPEPEPTPEPTPEPPSSYTLVDLSENLSDADKEAIIANLGLDTEPEQPTLEDLSDSLTEEQRTSIIANLGIADSKAVEEVGTEHVLQPNTHYDIGEAARLEFTLEAPKDGITNEYSFSFDSPSGNATLLVLPESIVWDGLPEVLAGRHYEVRITYNALNGNYYGKINQW